MRRVLDVSVVASQTGIKAAYRKKALQLHPDVSNAPDATERFAELSSAYGECHQCGLLALCRPLTALKDAFWNSFQGRS